ncbi:MAG TPA: hypothetical protein VF064_14840 [Pyrinomonadaceae bacterium]
MGTVSTPVVSSRLHGARKVEGHVLVHPVDELAQRHGRSSFRTI